MADKKISELTAITGANTAATDVFVVVDTSTGQTKKITREELNNAIEQDVLSSIDIDTINGDFSVNGNINLGDNAKAIFGAGSDLQIYHDGSDSYIRDAGTGSLVIQASENLKLQSHTGEFYFQGIRDGASKIYYDNAERLVTTATGIDVTGTVVSDGLSVDQSGAGATTASFNHFHANADWISFDWYGTNLGSITQVAGADLELAATYNMLFSTASSERMRIDSSGNLGVGTSSLSNGVKTVIQGSQTGGAAATSGTTQTYGLLRLQGTTFTSALDMGTNGGNYAWIQSTDQTNLGTNYSLVINPNGGNVGIGTSSPISTLDSRGDIRIYNNATDVLIFGSGLYQTIGGSSGSNDINYRTYANHIFKTGTGASSKTDGTERLRIDSSGNVGIGTTSPSGVIHAYRNSGSPTILGRFENPSGEAIVEIKSQNDALGILQFADSEDGNVGAVQYSHPENSMRFKTNDTERMRIDSSGNVLVGKTSAVGQSTSGIEVRGDGVLIATKAGTVQYLNRTGSDGEIARFSKDGSTVGSIGTTSDDIYIGSGDTALFFDSATDSVKPRNGDGTSRDNAIDLGASAHRFDDIFATNGTIQTSDRNEKQDIEALSEAEQRVAVAAKGLLRKFRWKDSVEEKGDDARIHFGIIAQDLQAAFEAEGLDAGRYAMFINSTWTDEETGEERSRMGVRYNQLLAFIIAAI